MAIKAEYNNTSVCTIGTKKIETPSYQGFQADVREIARISTLGNDLLAYFFSTKTSSDCKTTVGHGVRK
jgi:hypothetical protein